MSERQRERLRLRLRVDPIGCTGHGICAELLPEMIYLDDWGYPILSDRPVPPGVVAMAKRTVSACPALALRLEREAAEATGARR